MLFYCQEQEPAASVRDSSGLLELKKQMSAALIVNHFEEARTRMDEIVEKCFVQDMRCLPYNQCQAYALIGMILDKLEDSGLQDQGMADYPARLLRTHSVRELKEELHAVLDDIVKYRRENLTEPDWVEQIQTYIDENYREPNLSIAYIAEHFSMSPSYVGNRFRKLKGIGILDYIHMVRMKACKELLADGKTIKACAEAVGYSDIKTMQRAFKRYEGISPGQYKEGLNVSPSQPRS